MTVANHDDREESLFALLSFLTPSAENLWVTGCVFFSLLFLFGSFAKAAVVAVFLLGNLCLGHARRRLSQLSILITLLAFAVAFGFPPPSHWIDMINSGVGFMRGL